MFPFPRQGVEVAAARWHCRSVVLWTGTSSPSEGTFWARRRLLVFQHSRSELYVLSGGSFCRCIILYVCVCVAFAIEELFHWRYRVLSYFDSGDVDPKKYAFAHFPSLTRIKTRSIHTAHTLSSVWKPSITGKKSQNSLQGRPEDEKGHWNRPKHQLVCWRLGDSFAKNVHVRDSGHFTNRSTAICENLVRIFHAYITWFEWKIDKCRKIDLPSWGEKKATRNVIVYWSHLETGH